MEEKWEYKIDLLPNTSGEEDLINWLNFLGQDGWELVNYKWEKNGIGLIDIEGIFKRKIQQVSNNSDSGDFRDNTSQFYDK